MAKPDLPNPIKAAKHQQKYPAKTHFFQPIHSRSPVAVLDVHVLLQPRSQDFFPF